MNKQSGFVGIILAIIVGGATLGGYLWYRNMIESTTLPDAVYKQFSQPNPSSSSQITSTPSEQASTNPVTSKTDVTVTSTTENGSATTKMTTDNTESCGTKGCFDKAFVQCIPAWEIVKGPFDTSKYTILGPVTGGCQMTQQYITISYQPDWKNAQMTCTYNNKKPVLDAAADIVNSIIGAGSVQCSGNLYQLWVAKGAAVRNASSLGTPDQGGTVNLTPYLDTTVNGLEFRTNFVTAAQVNVTVTDTTTGKTQTISLPLSSSTVVVGHKMTVTSIQQVKTGTANGQPIYDEQATLNFK